MSKVFAYGILISLTLCGTAVSQQAAGIVLYFKSGTDVFLLMAEHAGSDRGWAGFGGGGSRTETAAETAARKVDEETRGYFKRANLLELIKDQSPVMDGNFALYFAEIPFVPAQRVMNHPITEPSEAYYERSAFAWMPYSILEGFLQQNIDSQKKYGIDPDYLPSGSQSGWLWPVWLKNMRVAVKKESLPWQKQ